MWFFYLFCFYIKLEVRTYGSTASQPWYTFSLATSLDSFTSHSDIQKHSFFPLLMSRTHPLRKLEKRIWLGKVFQPPLVWTGLIGVIQLQIINFSITLTFIYHEWNVSSLSEESAFFSFYFHPMMTWRQNNILTLSWWERKCFGFVGLFFIAFMVSNVLVHQFSTLLIVMLIYKR